jgi:hypothetical protein
MLKAPRCNGFAKASTISQCRCVFKIRRGNAGCQLWGSEQSFRNRSANVRYTLFGISIILVARCGGRRSDRLVVKIERLRPKSEREDDRKWPGAEASSASNQSCGLVIGQRAIAQTRISDPTLKRIYSARRAIVEFSHRPRPCGLNRA